MMVNRLGVAVSLSVGVCLGCKTMQELGDAYARGVAVQQGIPTPATVSPTPETTSATPAPAQPDSSKLMLFGGQDHHTYLGCLSCSQYTSDSVFNQYGTHGSRYSPDSVLNPSGEFGSPYANYSACNPSATDPPVIVNSNGEFFGRLTINKSHLQGTNIQTLSAWIAGVCQR